MSAPSMHHLTAAAARARRELELAVIERDFEGVKARITAERDAAHQAEILALFAVVRDVMDGNVQLAADGLIVGAPARRRAAVDVIFRRLVAAHERLQLTQSYAESAWAEAREARDMARQPFAFDLGAAA